MVNYSYSHLKSILDNLEGAAQKLIPKSNPDLAMINGQIQFYGIDRDPSEKSEDEELPVIVCCGSNFYQDPSIFSYPTPYTTTLVGPSACTNLGNMRRNLVNLLLAYGRNVLDWEDRFYASPGSVSVPSRFRILATNFSPFLTQYSWLDHVPARRANLITALDFSHLNWICKGCSSASIGPITAEIWIGHGIDSDVYPLFRQWQRMNSLAS